MAVAPSVYDRVPRNAICHTLLYALCQSAFPRSFADDGFGGDGDDSARMGAATAATRWFQSVWVLYSVLYVVPYGFFLLLDGIKRSSRAFRVVMVVLPMVRVSADFVEGELVEVLG